MQNPKPPPPVMRCRSGGEVAEHEDPVDRRVALGCLSAKRPCPPSGVYHAGSGSRLSGHVSVKRGNHGGEYMSQLPGGVADTKAYLGTRRWRRANGSLAALAF